MHNRQLPRHGQHRAFARGIRKLRRRTTHQGHNTRRINNTALRLLVTSQTQHCMFTSIPHTLHINIVRQIPDLVWGVNGIRVVGVHDPRIVEYDVRTAPAVLRLDHGLHVGFLGDVAFDGFDAYGGVWDERFDLCEGCGEGGLGDVGH